MNWSKENLGKLYLQKFGINLTPEELDWEWGLVPQSTVTPPGNDMNTAVTPLWVKTYVGRELARTGLTLEDQRFKKVREEIEPTMNYVLFLKKIGQGEHFICSSDNPDIKLVKRGATKVSGSAHKIGGIPVEVTFVNDHSISSVAGSDSAEKLVAVIEKNKLSKSYDPNTTLLVVVDTILHNLDLEKVVLLLHTKAKNFNNIDLWINEGNGDCVVACVYPELATCDINLERDLYPLIY